MKEIISVTMLLLIIMDPLGNLPIFMLVLKPLEQKRRNVVIIREMIIALIIMLLFLFTGEKMLNLLNLRTEIVSISGGIILFLIAIKMIFASSPDQCDNNYISSTVEEPFIVPLAIPFIAGPTLLATLILLSHKYQHRMISMISALLGAWLGTLVILLLSGIFLRLLGDKGISALERLMGLILVMLATQMVLDGIRIYLSS
ncbi:MAG: YhgN family NAAT transporter [Candidatus Dasytiphilus stammeri]